MRELTVSGETCFEAIEDRTSGTICMVRISEVCVHNAGMLSKLKAVESSWIPPLCCNKQQA
jgi:hypothetical protein